MGGKPVQDNFKEKYNSVNIGDEETQKKEENDRLKIEIEKERKLAFNACSILKMEVEYIGNFFFGKKIKKDDKNKLKDKKTFSEDEYSEEADDERENDGNDYTLSKFYQSNTRQDLQNQLKDLNFEDEDEEVNTDDITKEEEDEIVNGTSDDSSEEMEIKTSELLSGSDEENEKEFKIESGGRDESKGEANDKGRKVLFYLK
jgi:hypothetical protein